MTEEEQLEEKWWHLDDWLSREDELQAAILKILVKLKNILSGVQTIKTELKPQIGEQIVEPLEQIKEELEKLEMPNQAKMTLSNPDITPQSDQQTATSAGSRLQVNYGSVSLPYPATGVIRALPSNTGDIYIGDEDVLPDNGMPLQAGEDTGRLHIDDLSKYYVYIENADDGFAFLTG